MKFETKCGLGEIVLTHMRQAGHEVVLSKNRDTAQPDLMGEVISIAFDRDSAVRYFVRLATGIVIICCESELIPDPTFNQETGYPPETDLSELHKDLLNTPPPITGDSHAAVIDIAPPQGG